MTLISTHTPGVGLAGFGIDLADEHRPLANLQCDNEPYFEFIAVYSSVFLKCNK